MTLGNTTVQKVGCKTFSLPSSFFPTFLPSSLTPSSLFLSHIQLEGNVHQNGLFFYAEKINILKIFINLIFPLLGHGIH